MWAKHGAIIGQHTSCCYGLNIKAIMGKHTSCCYGLNIKAIMGKHTSCCYGLNIKAVMGQHTSCCYGLNIKAIVGKHTSGHYRQTHSEPLWRNTHRTKLWENTQCYRQVWKLVWILETGVHCQYMNVGYFVVIMYILHLSISTRVCYIHIHCLGTLYNRNLLCRLRKQVMLSIVTNVVVVFLLSISFTHSLTLW